MQQHVVKCAEFKIKVLPTLATDCYQCGKEVYVRWETYALIEYGYNPPYKYRQWFLLPEKQIRLIRGCKGCWETGHSWQSPEYSQFSWRYGKLENQFKWEENHRGIVQRFIVDRRWIPVEDVALWVKPVLPGSFEEVPF